MGDRNDSNTRALLVKLRASECGVYCANVNCSLTSHEGMFTPMRASVDKSMSTESSIFFSSAHHLHRSAISDPKSKKTNANHAKRIKMILHLKFIEKKSTTTHIFQFRRPNAAHSNEKHKTTQFFDANSLGCGNAQKRRRSAHQKSNLRLHVDNTNRFTASVA